MTTQQAALKLQELNRQQRQILHAMAQQQEVRKAPKKRRKLNLGMCFFWLNALGFLAFIASNVAIKLALL